MMTVEDKYWLEKQVEKDRLEEELETEPTIQPGDTVVIPERRIKATIDKLYYAFRCVEWHKEKQCYVKHYDVEFVDTKGNYRHWKSYFDGGYIEYAERR